MTLAEHLRTVQTTTCKPPSGKKKVILKDICSTLSFPVAVAEGCAKASGDSFLKGIQGKKFLKGFKKRWGKCHSRENFSFSRIKIHPDQTTISYTEEKKTNPEFGILGPSAVENMEISWKYTGCKVSPAQPANGKHHWAKQEWKPHWKSRINSKKWGERVLKT